MRDAGPLREYVIPAPNGEREGHLVCCELGPDMALFVYHVHSTRIRDVYPISAFRPDARGPYLIVNYCVRGRCELELTNGDFTYLGNGELALDTGQVNRKNTAFCYPGADYCGLALAVRPGTDWNRHFSLDGAQLSAPDALWAQCQGHDRPVIIVPDSGLRRALEQAMDDMSDSASVELVLLDTLRILILLRDMEWGPEPRRSYYTRSQTQIAKATMRILTEDVSTRHSAAELAARFGVSETSLKSYFCGVYGCGYRKWQRELRMRRAAELLRDGGQSVCEVSAAVGFSSQSRFAKAFREHFGMTPLEYRRRARLEGD